MFYVYYLKSSKNGDIYVGLTKNLENRIRLHNSGRVRSTKFYRPWKLLNFEVYNLRSEAMKREMFLKTGQQKELLRRKHGLVAK